jgi:hypothetical protein
MAPNTWPLNEVERRRWELEEGANLAIGRLVMRVGRDKHISYPQLTQVAVL